MIHIMPWLFFAVLCVIPPLALHLCQVVAGANRRYLVAPLGNLVDERYTVYFNVQSPHSGV